jgi:uncharacterized protein YacL (UPF0231 family)
MKKVINFWLIAAAVAMCAGFTSCEGDDDNGGGASTSPLVGAWSQTEYLRQEKVDGQSLTDDIREIYDAAEEIIVYTFNADGTVTAFNKEENDEGSASWELNGNELSISVDGEETEIYTVTINGTTLVMEKTETFEDGTVYETYTKMTFSKIR